MWRVSMHWRAAADRALADLGLTHAQYALLASLYGMSTTGATPSQRELADFTGLEPIYVSKLARTLEKEGLIVRAEHAADSRAVQLTLTPRGYQVIEPAIARIATLHDELTQPLGGLHGEGTRQLMALLRSLLSRDKGEPS
jgi:DNA-binding MarR family transcriptional regulator